MKINLEFETDEHTIVKECNCVIVKEVNCVIQIPNPRSNKEAISNVNKAGFSLEDIFEVPESSENANLGLYCRLYQFEKDVGNGKGKGVARCTQHFFKISILPLLVFSLNWHRLCIFFCV